MDLRQRKHAKQPEDAEREARADRPTQPPKPRATDALLLYVCALSPAVLAAIVLSSLPKLLGPELGGAIVQKALGRAFRGGIPGAISALLQIALLMWLRTTINYQYKHGLGTGAAMRALWAEGGVGRFYRGWHVAAAQVPISRFVDAAANAGMLELFAGAAWLPVFMKTAAASVAAGLFRATLMPMDCIKTELQVNGAKAMPGLRERLAREGPATLFRGTAAAMTATAVGHYPWFAVKNMLDAWVASAGLPQDNALLDLTVDATVGFVASMASDTATNSIRVVKTTVQTAEEDMGYAGAVKLIVERDGWFGLFFRGLGTKTLTSALNGVIFNVMLKQFR